MAVNKIIPRIRSDIGMSIFLCDATLSLPDGRRDMDELE